VAAARAGWRTCRLHRSGSERLQPSVDLDRANWRAAFRRRRAKLGGSERRPPDADHDRCRTDGRGASGRHSGERALPELRRRKQLDPGRKCSDLGGHRIAGRRSAFRFDRLHRDLECFGRFHSLSESGRRDHICSARFSGVGNAARRRSADIARLRRVEILCVHQLGSRSDMDGDAVCRRSRAHPGRVTIRQ